jgi:hypothetical protein
MGDSKSGKPATMFAAVAMAMMPWPAAKSLLCNASADGWMFMCGAGGDDA